MGDNRQLRNGTCKKRKTKCDCPACYLEADERMQPTEGSPNKGQRAHSIEETKIMIVEQNTTEESFTEQAAEVIEPLTE